MGSPPILLGTKLFVRSADVTPSSRSLQGGLNRAGYPLGWLGTSSVVLEGDTLFGERVPRVGREWIRGVAERGRAGLRKMFGCPASRRAGQTHRSARCADRTLVELRAGGFDVGVDGRVGRDRVNVADRRRPRRGGGRVKDRGPDT